MEKILVSACLLGECCRYDGCEKACDEVCEFLKGREYVKICPEVMGGLTTPRAPSEISGERVINKNGEDVTYQYLLGAFKALQISREQGIKVAVLKERSPSCGSRVIYNGSFSGALVSGKGVCARILEENGIRVYGESEIGKICDL